MRETDFTTHAVLCGLKRPASDSNRATVIAKGKLSDLIKQGLELSDEYYGLTIAFAGGTVWHRQMREIAERPDFPK